MTTHFDNCCCLFQCQAPDRAKVEIWMNHLEYEVARKHQQSAHKTTEVQIVANFLILLTQGEIRCVVLENYRTLLFFTKPDITKTLERTRSYITYYGNTITSASLNLLKHTATQQNYILYYLLTNNFITNSSLIATLENENIIYILHTKIISKSCISFIQLFIYIFC